MQDDRCDMLPVMKYLRKLLGFSEVTVDRDGVFRELRACVRRLALPGPFALTEIPEGTCKPDELALDYDNFCSAVLGNFESELTPEPSQALRRLDALLTSMSGPEHPELWTEEAVCGHPKWQIVRDEAGRIVSLFGWDRSV